MRQNEHTDWHYLGVKVHTALCMKRWSSGFISFLVLSCPLLAASENYAKLAEIWNLLFHMHKYHFAHIRRDV